MTTTLILGANIGDEFFYNDTAFYYKESGMHLKTEISSIKNIKTYNNKKPTYSYDNNGNKNNFQYPAGAEAASFKYSYKNGDITYENPIFTREINWISPNGIVCKPLHLIRNSFRDDGNFRQYATFEITDWQKEYWTAPTDGVLRIVAGICGNYPKIITANWHSQCVYCSLNSLYNYESNITKSKTVEEYIWINDIPYTLTNETSIKLGYGNAINSFYSYAYPIPLKAGDKICYHPNYYFMYRNVHPDISEIGTEYDFSSSSNDFRAYYMNGVFYPYKP